AVTNEDFVFERDAFTDEGVAGNFAATTDLRVLLDFNERSDFGFVTDFATVQIDESENAHAPAEFNVRGDQLMSLRRIHNEQNFHFKREPYSPPGPPRTLRDDSAGARSRDSPCATAPARRPA